MSIIHLEAILSPCLCNYCRQWCSFLLARFLMLALLTFVYVVAVVVAVVIIDLQFLEVVCSCRGGNFVLTSLSFIKLGPL